ncbi:RidA family protein [Bombilactobacillus apium]|uniref:RidA family protein n=1 Tax=Bombilactobacillus apium TaxID=2675299 RepID=UPI001E49CB29|nr:RidA family protein [Bombilactobacillus apium]
MDHILRVWFLRGVLYSSGQGPLDPQSGDVPVGITAQTELAYQNIVAVLKASKSDFKAVLKTTCFLQDVADFDAFNQIYARYFILKPTRTCVAVNYQPIYYVKLKL